MCGIVGMFARQAVAEDLYDSLIHLQHRGQDAAGILTSQERFDSKTGLGLVREIFRPEDISALRGNIGLGHCRYPTAGGQSLSDVQPIWLGSPRGIALAHNGNIINYRALAEEFTKVKHRHLYSSSDSEVLLHLLAESLETEPLHMDDTEMFFQQLSHAVRSVFQRAHGSYSVVSTIMGKGLLAFRDPHGIRPLEMGVRYNAAQQAEYIIASENTMFYPLGFDSIGSIAPGELVFINQQGRLFRETLQQKPFKPCIFEYVYFARPDAVLDDVSVYRARLRMGQNLARQWKKRFPNQCPDVVIPAPFTANTAALAMAKELGVRYSEGLYKNPFIGRTFIMPDNHKRQKNIRYKLIPQPFEIQNKKVLIVDDSIVRGNTSKEIVSMVREHQAKKVYFASACPPISHPCFYGIDVPSKEELIINQLSEADIQAFLNVDALLYQTLDDLVEAVTRKGEHRFDTTCLACMNGEYITGDLCAKRREQLKNERYQKETIA